jgi:hypothetical protein
MSAKRKVTQNSLELKWVIEKQVGPQPCSKIQKGRAFLKDLPFSSLFETLSLG